MSEQDTKVLDWVSGKWVNWQGSTGATTKAHFVRVGAGMPMCKCLTWVPTHALTLRLEPRKQDKCSHCWRLILKVNRKVST